MTHYVLTLSARQAGVLLRSTELAAALGIGRLRDITSAPLPVRDLATRDELRRRLEALEPWVTGHGANIWLSISAPQVHDDAKIGHDLAQVIAYRLAWDHTPEGEAAVDCREPMQVGPEPLAAMVQVSDDAAGQTRDAPGMTTLTEDELVVIRGALHEEISRARQVPTGTETDVYQRLVRAYQKVIAWLERLQPGRPEHDWHQAFLVTAEHALSTQQSGPATPMVPLNSPIPRRRTSSRFADRRRLKAEVWRLRSVLRYIYRTYCNQQTEQGYDVAWRTLTVEIPAVIEGVLPGIARGARGSGMTAPPSDKG